jgi:outer membrane immunogenic protein
LEKIMKKFLLGTVALAALGVAAPAFAADLPARAPVYAKAPALAAVYNWTGFYVGIFGGGGWGNHYRHNTAPFDNNYTSAGGLVGGTIGYNYQMNNFVLGVEGDLAWASIVGNDASVGGTLDETRLNWIGSVRARGGIAFGNALIFATGGWAFAQQRHFNDGAPGDTFTTNTNGWTVGGGLEYAFNNNWSAKGEYRYYDFARYSRPVPANGITPYDVRSTYQTVTIGLNYRFGGPVVARY